MTPGRILALVRAAFCAAIMGCAILENDYRHLGDPAFCGVASPCYKLRASQDGMRFAVWLAPYHMTLPQLGLLGFVALMAISFFVKTRTYLQAFSVITTFAGAAALYLMIVQARLHTFCPYCMVVDTSTLIAAVGSLVLLRVLSTEKVLEQALKSTFAAPVTFLWGLAAALSTAAPYVWADHPTVPPLPKQLAEMQVPGKLTVVSITDFQCPFCRKTAPILTKIHDRPDVVLKRVMAPLYFHPGAEPAARAYLCAPEEKQKTWGEYMEFTKSIKASGNFKAGDALQKTSTATTVRIRDGKQLVTDGPFAETREQLGGYYLIEAKDLDEARAIAARIPGARFGSIEVRPIMKMPTAS